MTGTCRSNAPALTTAWLAALAIAATVLISASVHAETIAVGDEVSVRPSDVDRPGRSMTMKTVEAKFGAPQERHPAVGVPAITRWDYPTFTVFFENEHVIHAVVNPGA